MKSKREVKFSWHTFGGITFAVIAGFMAINGLLKLIPDLFHALFQDEQSVHLFITTILLFGVWILSCIVLLLMAYLVLVEIFKKKKKDE